MELPKFQRVLQTLILCYLSITSCIAASSTKPPLTSATISSNPAAVNTTPGTGIVQRYIEKRLNIKDNHGIYIDGAWLIDTNKIFSGGIPHKRKWTSNSSFILSLTADTQKMFAWEGGLFGVQFLQFNGQPTNEQVGTIQGYNSLPGPKPLQRAELYQLWFRQTFFNKKFIVRVGKQVPTADFNNVVRPVPLTQEWISIPAVSGLIYTPIFVNSTMLGVIPGYYNSAYGITFTLAPIKEWYASYGVYDGNLANGTQTGIKVGPTFNGSYYHIGETGFAWLLGQYKKPGDIAMGLWHQSGNIKGAPTIHENNATGFYLFGTQRLWYRNPGIDNSGISSFYQYGSNNSEALPIKRYLGAGLTAFGLIPYRCDDSMGLGGALAWPNRKIFQRTTELMLQAYYQAKIINGIYLEPVLSYIPTPGASKNLPAAWAGSLRAIILF